MTLWDAIFIASGAIRPAVALAQRGRYVFVQLTVRGVAGPVGMLADD